jgi:hypothetical protein
MYTGTVDIVSIQLLQLYNIYTGKLDIMRTQSCSVVDTRYALFIYLLIRLLICA